MGWVRMIEDGENIDGKIHTAPRAEQFALLFELSRAFSSLIELDELLPYVALQTRTVLQAESCAILLLDQEPQELYFAVISDADPAVEKRLKDIRFPADRGIVGWVVQRAEPTLVTDVASDKRFFKGVDQQS